MNEERSEIYSEGDLHVAIAQHRWDTLMFGPLELLLSYSSKLNQETQSPPKQKENR